MKSYLNLAVSLVAVAAFVGLPARGERMEETCSPLAQTSVVLLPKPRSASGISVEEAIQKRRSVRQYKDDALTLAEVAQLLWAAQGVTSPRGFRAAPSAGALYPLELYLISGRVTGLPAGIYRYIPGSHTLVPVRTGDRRRELAQAALNQPAIESAPASLAFSAVYARTAGKYGERGVRYVHMDLGHAAENVYLQGVALGVATVLVGAFDDAAVAKALCLPAAEEPLAIMPLGKKRGAN